MKKVKSQNYLQKVTIYFIGLENKSEIIYCLEIYTKVLILFGKKQRNNKHKI